jgi:bacillithiol system protein YtxJ
MMNSLLREIGELGDLADELAGSATRPVLLFKHSLTCPISSRAYREFETYLEHPNPNVSYGLITVQHSRQVSDEAARRLGVKHESPQAILVSHGRVLWHASHMEITAAEIENALASVTAPGP